MNNDQDYAEACLREWISRLQGIHFYTYYVLDSLVWERIGTRYRLLRRGVSSEAASERIGGVWSSSTPLHELLGGLLG